MRRLLGSAFAIALLPQILNAGETKPDKSLPPPAIHSDTVSILGYSTMPATSPDTIRFQTGDSVFVFDGDLYYRARAGEREFFISRRQILSRSDSLVIYQNYRLVSKMPGPLSSDTTISYGSVGQKVERQRCVALTKNGSRCKRLAVAGSDKCWQHKDEK